MLERTLKLLIVRNDKIGDFILILPWNIADEVKSQNSWATKKGIKFVIAIPKLVISFLNRAIYPSK